MFRVIFLIQLGWKEALAKFMSLHAGKLALKSESLIFILYSRFIYELCQVVIPDPSFLCMKQNQVLQPNFSQNIDIAYQRKPRTNGIQAAFKDFFIKNLLDRTQKKH